MSATTFASQVINRLDSLSSSDPMQCLGWKYLELERDNNTKTITNQHKDFYFCSWLKTVVRLVTEPLDRFWGGWQKETGMKCLTSYFTYCKRQRSQILGLFICLFCFILSDQEDMPSIYVYMCINHEMATDKTFNVLYMVALQCGKSCQRKLKFYF